MADERTDIEKIRWAIREIDLELRIHNLLLRSFFSDEALKSIRIRFEDRIDDIVEGLLESRGEVTSEVSVREQWRAVLRGVLDDVFG